MSTKICPACGCDVDREPTLGEYLRGLRRARDLTLREVERLTGGTVSNPYLCQLETGKVKNPSPAVLDDLAWAYGVDYHELIDRAWPRRRRD